MELEKKMEMYHAGGTKGWSEEGSAAHTIKELQHLMFWWR